MYVYVQAQQAWVVAVTIVSSARSRSNIFASFEQTERTNEQTVKVYSPADLNFVWISLLEARAQRTDYHRNQNETECKQRKTQTENRWRKDHAQ